jgi:ferrous iron transport protein A
MPRVPELPAPRSTASLSLAAVQTGFHGRVQSIRAADAPGALPALELERRLIELGFVEEAEVQVLHHGPFGRDPIAVRVGDTTFALRRAEARAILVEARAS